jgi:hypothetical protein
LTNVLDPPRIRIGLKFRIRFIAAMGSHTY